MTTRRSRYPSPFSIPTIRERLRWSRSNVSQALSYDAVVFVHTSLNGRPVRSVTQVTSHRLAPMIPPQMSAPILS